MIRVTLEGFSSMEQAKEFCSWFEGQGEQDLVPWFEESGIPAPLTDMTTKWLTEDKENSTYTIKVK